MTLESFPTFNGTKESFATAAAAASYNAATVDAATVDTADVGAGVMGLRSGGQGPALEGEGGVDNEMYTGSSSGRDNVLEEGGRRAGGAVGRGAVGREAGGGKAG